MKRIAALALLLSMGLLAHAQTRPAAPVQTVIYFVRHGETDNGQPTRPLSAAGLARRTVLVTTLRDMAFTHVFSSHTTRTRQMVEAIAAAHGLTVVQLPARGTIINGRPVSDATPTGAAAGPLTDALRRLPAGSRALVGVNRENVFAVMNGLGVAVPCLDVSCFPGGRDDDYDHLWIVTIVVG